MRAGRVGVAVVAPFLVRAAFPRAPHPRRHFAPSDDRRGEVDGAGADRQRPLVSARAHCIEVRPLMAAQAAVLLVALSSVLCCPVYLVKAAVPFGVPRPVGPS